MPSALAILPIPADVLDDVRSGRSGVPLERAPAGGGEPLRCCLRDAERGEGLILFAYRPPLPAESPYREQGAVFAHAERCAGRAVADYPADWSGRPQVLRAYDAEGRIHPASRLHDGADPVAALTEILAADGVVEVHSRNVVYGCFMFAARYVTGSGR